MKCRVRQTKSKVKLERGVKENKGNLSPVLARNRSKRSGLEAVKLYLQVSGGTGRTSRSATTVRKTSLRMSAIKEYPFDLSDLQNQRQENSPPPRYNEIPPAKNNLATPDGKRKVSIMADEHKSGHTESRNGRVSAQAEGPSRRKSNLHNAMAAEMDTSWERPTHIEGRYKKYSTTSSVHSKKAHSHHSEHVERSWWYACCQKCHSDDSGIPTWEPPHWQKFCPYPLCPSYRHFAQNLSVLIIGILVWLIVWMVLGDTAAPGGQLFMLASLTIAANIGGWLMVKLTTLPALIGMLFTGVLLKNIGFVNFDSEYLHVCSYIRKIALTIILTRAGLDLDPMAMKKCFFSVIKLAVVPWTFEFVLCAVMSNLLLGLPWDWAFLLGSVVAAVSPAVVVPCLFRLRSKGYGVSKGIPTLVLAVSGVDDAISVAIFGILASIMFSSSSVTMNIIQGPLSVIIGIAFGVLCGYLIKYIPERNDAFLVPLRVLLLLTGGLASIFGSEEIGWGGAGPMAVIAFSYVACKNWVEQGWELDDNPVATANEIFWMFFEPMLFSITGAQVVIADLPPNLVLVSVGILMTCVILRAMVTSASAVCSNLNMKEKIFVGFSWMAKATVQAALATVPLDYIRKLAGNNEPSSELVYYADTIITICILSIILTAPLGAIIITITGPRLLSKTSKPPVLEGWRRSHRPSIRDISIIDEEEIAERDAEVSGELHHSPPSTPDPTTKIPTAFSTPNPITVQPNHRT
ncbi:sodium/hydrogen exchanger 9B2-like isoform X1 [Pieris napi]|uniref:sodium/hydrogen exchanger 9B2-like isoform X1 n=2 Tax=Pieris napi TaxID=78633 RepID=UPI001FBB821D|nr:sodium/hydrogen exchanger 9B2-like isoform X1 [Pieris napi]XP_047515461.1 sodium/hydrogen exchanger 9B2-like isoform X1 [Pieris napi]